MIKPSVGLTVLTSSFIIFFTIVVLPALSRPLSRISSCLLESPKITHSIRILISLSFRRAFLRIDNILSLVQIFAGGKETKSLHCEYIRWLSITCFHFTGIHMVLDLYERQDTVGLHSFFSKSTTSSRLSLTSRNSSRCCISIFNDRSLRRSNVLLSKPDSIPFQDLTLIIPIPS